MELSNSNVACAALVEELHDFPVYDRQERDAEDRNLQSHEAVSPSIKVELAKQPVLMLK